MTTENKKKAISKKNIVIVLLVGCVYAYIRLGSESSNSTPQPAKEVVKITATELFNAYDDNEVATDNRIGDAMVEVSGVIQAIDKDFSDDVVINLRTSNEFMPARMHMDDTQKGVASQLKKGQKVAISCQKMRRVIGAPSGSKCIFV